MIPFAQRRTIRVRVVNNCQGHIASNGWKRNLNPHFTVSYSLPLVETAAHSLSRVTIKTEQRRNGNLDLCGLDWEGMVTQDSSVLHGLPWDFSTSCKGSIALLATQAPHLRPPWLLSLASRVLSITTVWYLPLVSFLDASFLFTPVFTSNPG